MSGNEIYCLSKKGFVPGDIVVGNSVNSLGIAGGIGMFGRSLAGGEIGQLTSLISDGRHLAIQRMEHEAARVGAHGITGVASEARSLGGYTEFLAQGTSITGQASGHLFTTSASGTDLYCHLDSGYRPMRFAMGNIAYALGLGRGVMGSLRQLARGEVKEYSEMYNKIRHIALWRLRDEAARFGANSVVDVSLQVVPHQGGVLELLMTGTASYHPRISPGPVPAERVVTSELTGEEFWNLASIGYAPVSLVMGTSVYALGVAGKIGTTVKALSRGELPELTSLVYDARENCLDLVRREAMSLGAERVVGNKLSITELSPGLIEVFAIGTAIRRVDGMQPATRELIPQAVIAERDSLAVSGGPMPFPTAVTTAGTGVGLGLLMKFIPALMILFFIIIFVLGILSSLNR
jgi:uncharacterized protein YbjQ (UPF0145 family)